MRPTKDDRSSVLPSDDLVPLKAVLRTEELNRRPKRPPDYETENRALAALVQALADSPRTILQTLADKILEFFRADSAGVSLLTEDGRSFYWPAIAGMWRPHIGGGTPRDFGPCGDVLDRNAPLLFTHFERRYTYFLPVTPLVEECLLVPFYVDGKAVGTIWAIAHNDQRKFDAEDMRQLLNLGRVASAAYQAVASLDASEQRGEALQQERSELSRRVAELQMANLEVQDARRAALNLMEDAVHSREAVETLNVALRDSERRFRQLADSMPQIVWAARPDGYIDYYNQRWYEYTGFAEAYGQESLEPILHPDDVQRCVETYFGCVQTGQPYLIEYRFKDRFRGGYRWFMGRALPIRNQQGEISRWFGTCTDIDDVKRAEEEREKLLASERAALAQAETANRVKDQFLAICSHELRTPLSAIQGWAEMLRRGELNEETSRHGLEIILRNVRAQTQIIKDLLDVSRVIAGKLRLEISAVELVPLIEAAMESARPTAEVKGIELTGSFDRSIAPFFGDAIRVQQIVWNLLSNAVKFTPKGGNVEIRLERETDSVKIVVEDTGIGIDQEFLPHVFDLFRQADSRTNRSFGGLGLGLAIVRNLTALHGGTVRAASAGAGKGSTFEVMLPAKPPANETTDEPETRLTLDEDTDLEPVPEGARPLDGARLLVVDDDPDSREMLNAALTAYGGEVRTCASSREALTTLKEWLPDFLVSDIGMPGEDGYNLIQQIRELPIECGGNIPALALTGYATLDDHHRALEAGYQIHMAKPVELGRLAAIATRLVERSRASRSEVPSETTQAPEL